MMFMAVFWLLAVVLIVRWLVVPGPSRLPPEQAQRTEAELGRLREDVDRLGRQVDRLLEEQTFLLKLLDSGDRPRLPERGSDPEP
jgi:hypothetical protein